MKKIQLFLQGAIIFMLACTAYLCGAYVTEYRNIQQDNESTVATIAVVNTDNGVTADGEYINYAEKLISYPDVNFEAASLTEAREGIENDRYAAFILIPGTFSESIQSVNTKPQKANITYAVNSNLREDVKIKTVNDIHNFILNLSTNISYIYVDSILKEVHAVQDDSDAIMENDTKDMDDRAGNLIRTEDALGRTRELTYNKRGKAETIRQADGSELTFTYDAHGNTQSITDAYGTTLTYKYDALNRLVSAGDNSGQRLQLAYDRKDFVTAVTNAAGSRREYQYDENGNPVCITDFDGSIIRREYNALSLLSKETDAEGNETEYSYDTMWNIKEIKRELLFYLDPMTGESNILFQTENESTRIVGYEDGDIYLFSDYHVYRKSLASGETEELFTLPEVEDYIFDWQGDYLIARYYEEELDYAVAIAYNVKNPAENSGELSRSADELLASSSTETEIEMEAETEAETGTEIINYIENQPELDDVLFGNGSVADSGSGIIATYNALLALGEDADADTIVAIISSYERNGIASIEVPFTGISVDIGIAPTAIEEYFSTRGYETVISTTTDPAEINEIGNAYDTSIVMVYKDMDDIREQVLTVSITKNKDGNYEVHNTNYMEDGQYKVKDNTDHKGYSTLMEAINAISDNPGVISTIGIRR